MIEDWIKSDSHFQVGRHSGTFNQKVSELPSLHKKKDSFNMSNNQLSYEPDDLILTSERTTESEYIGHDPDKDMPVSVESAIKQEIIEKDDISRSNIQELKKSDKERNLKVLQDGLDKRKKDIMMRRGTPLKSNSSRMAQNRAEKLRACKADHQKVKIKNEVEERKKIEALKIEQQKIIASRSISSVAQSRSAAKHTKARMVSKASPISYKRSKLSDSDPGSKLAQPKLSFRSTSVESNDSLKSTKAKQISGSTNRLSQSISSLPEQKKLAQPKLPIRSTSITCSDSPENTKARQLSGSTHRLSKSISSLTELKKNSNDSPKNTKVKQLSGSTHRLSQSISSLPELNKNSNNVRPEANSSPAHTQRFSDPKGITTEHASQKSAGNDRLPKITLHSDSQMKKIAALMQLDKTKSATLPKLKIRTSRGPSDAIQNKAITEEALQKGPGSKENLIFERSQGQNANEKLLKSSDNEDNPIYMITMVLEKGTITDPVEASEGVIDIDDGTHIDDRSEKNEIDSEYAVIHAPSSPIIIGEIKVPNEFKLDVHINSEEVVNDLNKESSHSNFTVKENFYQVSCARATSLEDSTTRELEYSEPEQPAVLNPEIASMGNGSIKTCIFDFPNPRSIDQCHKANEKPRSKEPKGFRKLFKFGRKSRSLDSGKDDVIKWMCCRPSH